jgi:polar amino acid transport system substrate-binding protein
MSRSIAILLAAFGFAAAAVSAPAQAASESPILSRILSSGTLRVGMSGGQPPLNFRSKSGELMGLEVDMAGALAGLMNLELKIVEKPFSELLGALAAGKVDLVISGLTITPERNTKSAFVGPYFLSGKSILTRSTSLAQVDETEDLNQSGLKFAALEGSTSQQFVESRLPKASLVTTPNYDEAVKLLLADEVSAVVADREIVTLTAFLHPKERLATLPETLTIEPIGIAVPPGDVLLVNYLENAMDALEASGFMSAARARWLERNDWVQQLP